MRKRTILAAVGLLALVACADPIGPPVGVPIDRFAAITREAGVNGGDVGSHILKHAESAPQLERYELSFWAVRGEQSYVQIRYLGGEVVGRDGEGALYEEAPGSRVAGSTFFWLYIPKYALEYRPDGSEIGWGERVRITIRVDLERLLVSLEPSGLTFNPQNRPWLFLSHAGADPDYDGDGNVDLVDAYVDENFVSLWSFEPTAADAPSEAQSSSGPTPKPPKNPTPLPGPVPKFSDVAVSW